ncbi:hypothetical protein HWV62_15699 [Athelia sp. TMB]|nr:hypothetical protein HWV62_15699 [Athelia sp. TMB]
MLVQAHMPFSPRQSLQSSRGTGSFNATPPPIAPKPGATPELPIFGAVEDDVKDAKRVGTHGQEEDLRAALGKIILRVEELSTLLRVAYRSKTDLETNLEVARSNLKLVQANNDMLEEALKRSDTKDVGWKRWSAREGLRIEEERPKSLDESARSNGSTASLPAQPPLTSSPPPEAVNPIAVSSPVSPNPPATTTAAESRFFRGFRFASSSGSSTPTTRASRSPTRSVTSPLNSPSLPSLVPEKVKEAEAAREKEREKDKEMELERQKEKEEREKKLEELTKALEKEKAERVKAIEDKAALEEEIESLSQALFEEANKMVAHERIKRAETEDELREAQQEKEALRSALKLLEGENGRLRVAEEDKERERAESRRAIDLRPSEEEGERRRSAIEIRDLDAIPHPAAAGPSRSRSSSEVGTKSPTLASLDVPLQPEESQPPPTLGPEAQPRFEPELHSDSPIEAPEETLESDIENAPETQARDASTFFLSPPEPNFNPATPRSYLLEEPSPWA